MRSPFPAMDPYLEHPELWPDVHHGLIEALRDSLAPQVRPTYRVAIEKRVYLVELEGLVFVGRPDVAITKSPVTPPPPGRGSAVSAGGSASRQFGDLLLWLAVSEEEVERESQE